MKKTVVVYKKDDGSGYAYVVNGVAGYPVGTETSEYGARLAAGGQLFPFSPGEYFIEGVHEPEYLSADHWVYDPEPVAVYKVEV